MSKTRFSRRDFLRGASALTALTAIAPPYAWRDAHAAASPALTGAHTRLGEEAVDLVIGNLRFNMELENGRGAHQPLKHTINVKPAERLSLAITADAPGRWALHCHLLLHMELGMFRVVEVPPAT